MREDKPHGRMPAGQRHQFPQWRLHSAGIVAPRRLGHMEVHRPTPFRGERQRRRQTGIVVAVTLGRRIQLAQPAEALAAAAFQFRPPRSFARTGMKGGERLQPVGMPAHGLREETILLRAGGRILPIPAEQDRAVDARRIHVAQQPFAVRPALQARAILPRRHHRRPPDLVPRRCPPGRIGKRSIGIKVDVAVDDHGRTRALVPTAGFGKAALRGIASVSELRPKGGHLRNEGRAAGKPRAQSGGGRLCPPKSGLGR